MSERSLCLSRGKGTVQQHDSCYPLEYRGRIEAVFTGVPSQRLDTNEAAHEKHKDTDNFFVTV
jgi:hypothetical protein